MTWPFSIGNNMRIQSLSRRVRPLTQRFTCALSIFALGVTSMARAETELERIKNDPTVPAWVKEDVPISMRAYQAPLGFPISWQERGRKVLNREGVMGNATKGIDKYQANHFIFYRPETAEFLYHDYTPTDLNYRRGTRPLFEKLVAGHTRPTMSPKEKALALLKAMPQIIRHPGVPPRYAPELRPDRALTDEGLVESGAGWCNEQARVYIRLCQAAGIPARMIFLFYAHPSLGKWGGHVVSEFYADGHWSFADTSWLVVCPSPDGSYLMSAAEVHDGDKMQWLAGKHFVRRFKELLAGPRDSFVGHEAIDLEGCLAKATAADLAAEFGIFGVLNYPLPRTLPSDPPIGR